MIVKLVTKFTFILLSMLKISACKLIVEVTCEFYLRIDSLLITSSLQLSFHDEISIHRNREFSTELDPSVFELFPLMQMYKYKWVSGVGKIR